jgi:hypothetical protein
MKYSNTGMALVNASKAVPGLVIVYQSISGEEG